MNVFPSLPGLAWSVSKAPGFATRIQKSVSGRTLALNDQPVPIWNWTLGYSVLRDDNDLRGASGPGAGYSELRTLMGFFLGQQGSYQPFLFDDPTDDRATGQALGTGDGTTTAFQLVRTMGSFAEPILAPNAVGAVYLNGAAQSPGGYSVDAGTGVVTFGAAPAAGAAVTADFTYWFRVRFADDSAEFENFLYQLWSLKQVKLTSVLN